MMRSIYEYFENYVSSTLELQAPNLPSKNETRILDETSPTLIEENKELIKIDLNDHQN